MKTSMRLEKAKNISCPSHPIAVFFHIIFRSLAIVAYFMCSWVKNITGRLLAGLRWWNYVDDNGDNHWIFEAKRIITGVALSLNIANLYGFIRCKFGSNEKISNVAGSYIREQMFKTVLSKVSGGLFEIIHSHGYLQDPPARSSAWLYDEDFQKCCQYYNHMEMFCGGTNHQWIINGGKCSICGEAYDLQPQLLGKGNSMYLGKIVRTYTQGSEISVTVVLSVNHLGHFEFRLCNIDDLTTDATQKCLDDTVLSIAHTSSTTFIVDKNASRSIFTVNLTLPSSLTCSHCVFQWKYVTGNSWGTNLRSGKSCLGCGTQNEEFYGCSDVAILSSNKVSEMKEKPSSKVILSSSTVFKQCTSAVTFAPSMDLSTVMEQYCRTVCVVNCASDKQILNLLMQQACILSCRKLCICE
ncbi:unnamed protein product [Didymodactylos carnosus]|uniref:Golgi apparatus membrane protein TVP23 homolog n=1 Tax=Didymodactylos carnosus TaxID=1234261 RepID=A0A813R0X7_9BILA|nr:unnamed protein product [Didymodactylos carnosus]CAF3559374.1 unnamed protein product [Didymodactylos carnosus]